MGGAPAGVEFGAF